MSLINWLLLFEVVASIGIIIWIVRRMHKHTKHNHAERSLKVHLEELEDKKSRGSNK